MDYDDLNPHVLLFTSAYIITQSAQVSPRNLKCLRSSFHSNGLPSHAADFKPPEEVIHPSASPPTKAPTTAGRALGYLGNLIFYGGLAGAVGFAASTYIYSDEQVKQLQTEAGKHRMEGLAAEVKARCWDYLADARVWYSEKVKELTGTTPHVICGRGILR